MNKKDIDLLEVDNLNKYIDYESCERIAQKYVIKKFNKEIEKNKTAEYGIYNYITVLDNIKGEYNAPRIIRTVNVLGGREVFIVGTKFFNPYPSVGGFRYTKITFFDKIDECILKLKEMNYSIYALQGPKHGGTCLYEQSFEANSAFISGHEQFGLSFNVCDYNFIKSIYIPQFGKVESLNVSVATSIVVSEYIRQFKN